MKTKKTSSEGLTRRDLLKASGVALGGLAIGGAFVDARAGARHSQCPPPYSGPTPAADSSSVCYRPSSNSSQGYSYFFGGNGEVGLETMDPTLPLDPNEMRISFMGSAVPPYGRAQMCMSVFVQVGWVQDEYFAKANPPVTKYKAQDQFIFDCGTGSTINYNAMNVHFNRMDKIFINHLHGDHMNDLGHIYCFGPSLDRKSPLFVWGPGPSGVKSPRPPRRLYDDGTKAFCKNLREAMRWHSESFGFQSTSYASYKPPTRHSWGLPCDPIPVGDDPINDAYAMIPIELDWPKYGKRPGDNVAYNNRETGVKITHFPVIHCRKGSIGYKVEWITPDGHTLSMIYTSDTKTEQHAIDQAKNYDARGVAKGVDVFIHEMGVPPEIWTMKIMGLDAPPAGNPQWWQDASRAR